MKEKILKNKLTNEHVIRRHLVQQNRENNKKGFLKSFAPVAKVVDKAATVLLFSMLGVTVGWTAKEVISEIVEEVTTENQIIDYGVGDYNYVFKNKEERTAEEVLNDVDEAVVNIEGMEQLMTNPDAMSMQDREDLLNDIIKVMNEVGGVEIEGYQLVESDHFFGRYWNVSVANLVVLNKNDIDISKEHFNGSSKEYTLVVFGCVHEMLHAIDQNNFLKSDSISELDKKIYCADKKDTNRYLTTFSETNVHLRQQLITKKVYEKYGMTQGKNLKIDSIMQELNTVTDNKYIDMSYSDAIKADMIERLDLSQAEILKIEDTYYYKDMEYLVSEFYGESLFEMNATDRAVYEGELKDVEFSITIARIHLYNKMAESSNKEYLNIAISLRYDYDIYSEEDVKLMQDFLVKNIDSIDEKSIEKYNLKSIVEAAETNDVSKIYKVEKLTETSILPDINFTAQDDTSYSITMDEIEH